MRTLVVTALVVVLSILTWRFFPKDPPIRNAPASPPEEQTTTTADPTRPTNRHLIAESASETVAATKTPAVRRTPETTEDTRRRDYAFALGGLERHMERLFEESGQERYQETLDIEKSLRDERINPEGRKLTRAERSELESILAPMSQEISEAKWFRAIERQRVKIDRLLHAEISKVSETTGNIHAPVLEVDQDPDVQLAVQERIRKEAPAWAVSSAGTGSKGTKLLFFFRENDRQSGFGEANSKLQELRAHRRERIRAFLSGR